MTVQKSVSTSLVFVSADGRGRVEIGSQVDFSYQLDSGAHAVVSLPLVALPTLNDLVVTLVADVDVQGMVLAATPEPEPPVEPEVVP